MKTKIENAQIIPCSAMEPFYGSIIFDESGILKMTKKGSRTAKASSAEASGAARKDVGGEADLVIDGTGMSVLPGFIDCHVHPAGLTEEDRETVAFRTYRGVTELLRSGITTVRTVGTRYGADIVLRDLINRGELDGPRILAAGEAICITCGHAREVGVECDTVGETLKAARGFCKRRVDWIKLMPTSGVLGIGPSTEVQLSKEQIEAAINVGRAFDTPVCAHLMNYTALNMCVELGITCVEHGYDMDTRIARMMKERGTWYIPTGVVTLMEMTYIKPDTPHNRDLVEKATQAQTRVRRAMKIAVAEGLKMGVGTDTGCPFTNPRMGAFAKELELYTLSGMANDEVLRCATIQGARLLGVDAVTGSLECGKESDMCVVKGDPLTDITAARNVQYTFRGGKLLYQTEVKGETARQDRLWE